MHKQTVMGIISSVFALAVASNAGAVLVDLGPASFSAAATAITFSDQPYGTVNPVYNFTGLTNLSGDGNFTVSFGGFFNGQANNGGYPDTLLDTTPTGPLSLDPASPQTRITGDGAAPDSPVLSGTPTFNGIISVLFSNPVAGVGLTGGYFNAIGATTIEAYDVNGASLGSIVNTMLGMEFYGLADSTGGNVISGISFYITGDEPAGFAIDNLTFGASDVIIDPGVDHDGGGQAPVPEPATMVLFGAGLAGFAGYGRRRMRK